MFTPKGAALTEGQRPCPVQLVRALAFRDSEMIEIGGPMRPAVAAPDAR